MAAAVGAVTEENSSFAIRKKEKERLERSFFAGSVYSASPLMLRRASSSSG